jgi:glycosyltransferase domain-containing protein
MSDDLKLTLILTIKDRSPFTLRWITYANKISFPFKVLIADGGKDSNLKNILSQTSRFPNIDYEYIRYPYDETYAQYYGKTADALSRVQTQFAVVGQDDDFFFKEGLQKAVDFLSAHKNYIAYNGRIDNFIIKPDPDIPYGKDVEFIKNPADESIEEKTATERISKHFGNYTNTLYSVYRTDVLRRNYETLCKYNFTSLILHELILSYLTVAQGIVKRENIFFLLRQINLKSSSNQAEHKKKGDYLDRMLIDSWSMEFSQFTNSIAKIISAKDKVDFEHAQQLVKKGYRKYLIPILALQVEEFQRKPSLIKKFIHPGLGVIKNTPLQKMLRSLFHIYQDMIDATPRPRPISRTSPLFKNVQPVHNFLTSEKECSSHE